jgi:hypothetical protein
MLRCIGDGKLAFAPDVSATRSDQFRPVKVETGRPTRLGDELVVTREHRKQRESTRGFIHGARYKVSIPLADKPRNRRSYRISDRARDGAQCQHLNSGNLPLPIRKQGTAGS